MKKEEIEFAAVDAARLYGELKTNTINEVKEAVFKQIEDINVQFVEMHTNWDMFDTHAILFKVNGKQIVSKVELTPSEQIDQHAALKAIAERISETVMNEMFKSRGIQSRILK